MAEVETVLIVGGGIAGLTLGRALHRQGFAVELVERSTAWRAEGGGIMVHANGMRMLRAIGLDGAVERAGARVRRWRFCDDAGEILSESDLEALWGDVGPCIGIERTRLQQALVAGVEGIPCRLGMSIQSLTRHDDCVSVDFSDGSSGTYDLVVGADGISSTARALALSTTPPAYTGAMAWRSVAPIRPQGLTSLQFLLGEGCFFGLCPVGNGHTYGFGNITGPRAHEPMEGRLDRLRGHFAGFGGIVQDYLAALAIRRADPLWSGRLAGAREMASGARGAYRRRRACELPDDGPGRLYGDGGRVHAGGKPAQQRHCGGGPRVLCREASAASELGAAGK
jgi:2-polyprenyl-6-methoxyphenol hydroxylase-like FAD-dependent oxidoreductase